MTWTCHAAGWLLAPAIVVAVHTGFSATGVGRSQTTTFTSGVDTVRVDVSVRQGGRAVAGLTPRDFEVSDNGVRQEVDLVGFEETPVHVVLALDMSGSVQGERLTDLRAAGERLVAMLEPGDTAAIVTFTNLVTIASGFTADKDTLRSALQQSSPGADTALIDATHAAMVLGDAESGRPLVIVFSDGTDTASFLSAELVLDTARRTGPVVYAVTTARVEAGGFIDDLVRLTGGRRLDLASLDRLSGTFAEILRESRERYLISYRPKGVSARGWHAVTVRVPGRRAEIRARPGYLATR